MQKGNKKEKGIKKQKASHKTINEAKETGKQK
jgi:hypothetical protein